MSTPQASEKALRAVVLSSAVAQFILPFQLAAVTPLLPAIGLDLHASAMEIGLVNAVYTMSLAIFHLPAGRLGDVIGHRNLMLLGVSVLVVMAGVVPFLPDVPLFLLGRFLQGVGTSLINTASVTLLMRFAPPSRRGQLLGTTVTGVFLGLSLGPAVGGLLAETLGWRWLFHGVMMLGLPVIPVVLLCVPDVPPDGSGSRYDWSSTLCWIAGVSLLSGGAVLCTQGWPALAAAGAGAALLTVFSVMQLHADRRGVKPIIDLAMAARNATFSRSSLIALLNYGTVIGQTFFLCLLLQLNYGLDMERAGVVLGAQAVMQLLLSRPAGRWADRHGSVNVTVVGLSLCSCATLTACTFTRSTPLGLVVAVLLTMGGGLALFASPNNATILGSVDREHTGQASGIIGTARTMGMLVSMAAASLTVGIHLGDAPASADRLPEFMAAMRTCMVLYCGMNLLALLTALRLRRLAEPGR